MIQFHSLFTEKGQYHMLSDTNVFDVLKQVFLFRNCSLNDFFSVFSVQPSYAGSVLTAAPAPGTNLKPRMCLSILHAHLYVIFLQ